MQRTQQTGHRAPLPEGTQAWAQSVLFWFLCVQVGWYMKHPSSVGYKPIQMLHLHKFLTFSCPFLKLHISEEALGGGKQPGWTERVVPLVCFFATSTEKVLWYISFTREVLHSDSAPAGSGCS